METPHAEAPVAPTAETSGIEKFVETTPAWLQDLQASPSEAPVAPAAPIMETPAVPQKAYVVEPAHVSQWIRDLQAQSHVVAQEPEHQVQAAPVETPPESISVPAAPIAAMVPPPTVSETATRPAAPIVPAAVRKPKRAVKGAERLAQARAYRDANQLPAALGEYDFVVQHAPRLVKDVIADLEALLEHIDAPLEAHRILGDAYTRADRLSEALERYRFVLEHGTSR